MDAKVLPYAIDDILREMSSCSEVAACDMHAMSAGLLQVLARKWSALASGQVTADLKGHE